MTSDGSGMEKVGFGRVWVYPKIQMSITGISGIKNVGFRWVRVLNLQVRAVISGNDSNSFSVSKKATF